MSVPSIACLKIVLEDVEPAVLRRVEVPLSIRLDRLHLALQEAMGWSNSHLYEIRAGGLGWGFVDPDDYASRLDAGKALLSDALLHSAELYTRSRGRFWGHSSRDSQWPAGQLMSDCVAKLQNDIPSIFRCALVALGFWRPNAL
jgi:hypothetical protein